MVPGAARAPFTLGRMSARPIPRPLLAAWTRPCRRNARVRADLRKYVASATATWQLDTTYRLGRFTGPSLVIWGRYDEVMPPEHAERLASTLNDARMVLVEESRTLMPLDAPEVLADHVREFVTEQVAAAPGERRDRPT